MAPYLAGPCAETLRPVADRSMRPDFMPYDPIYDGLRADPRFVDLLRRAGLPQ